MTAVTTAATTLGQAAAAGQGLARREDDQGHISVRLAEGKGDVVITIPLEVALKIIAFLVAALAIAVALAWHCWCGACRRGRPVAEEPKPAAAAGAPEGKPKQPRKPKTIYCEAGIQGPVHYNGVRYIHTNQGFQRGGEVTREVAAKPRRD